MRVLCRLLIDAEIVLASGNQPLMPQNLFYVPDWASIKKHDRRTRVSENTGIAEMNCSTSSGVRYMTSLREMRGTVTARGSRTSRPIPNLQNRKKLRTAWSTFLVHV